MSILRVNWIHVGFISRLIKNNGFEDIIPSSKIMEQFVGYVYESIIFPVWCYAGILFRYLIIILQWAVIGCFLIHLINGRKCLLCMMTKITGVISFPMFSLQHYCRLVNFVYICRLITSTFQFRSKDEQVVKKELFPFNLRFPFVICSDCAKSFMHEPLLPKHNLGLGYELEGWICL
jgi:hypothetical protein